MKRTLASLAGLTFALASITGTHTANAAGGGESTALSSLGVVTMTVQDGTFNGDTAEIPVKFAYERWGLNGEYGRVAVSVSNLSARQVGAQGDIGSQSDFVSWSFNAARKGTGDGTIRITGNAFIPNQPVLIYGSALFTRYTERFEIAEQIEVAFQPVLLISVAQEQTTLRDLQVGPRNISGLATVESSFGTVGAGGTVWVRYREPGEKRWTSVNGFVNCPNGVCLAVDPLGRFNATTIDPIPANARVEVSLVDCGWCTDVKQTVTRGKN